VVKSPQPPTPAHLIKNILVPENSVRFDGGYPGRAVPAGWLTLGVGTVARVEHSFGSQYNAKAFGC
tara:strand:+ start:288 stop:485 length:198 start_codon:yes stop_codon:yes gene_type:complete